MCLAVVFEILSAMGIANVAEMIVVVRIVVR